MRSRNASTPCAARPRTAREALRAAAAREAVRRRPRRDRRRRHAEAAEAELGAWAALDVDPDALAAAIGWTERARALLPSPPARAAARRLVAVTPDRAALDEALDTWRDAVDAFLPELDRESLTDDLEGDFDDAAALIDRLTRTRGDIETWIAHAAAVEALARPRRGGQLLHRAPRPRPAARRRARAQRAGGDRRSPARPRKRPNSARCAPPSATGSSTSTRSSTSGSSATPPTA